jgi:hypothetical protein
MHIACNAQRTETEKTREPVDCFPVKIISSKAFQITYVLTQDCLVTFTDAKCIFLFSTCGKYPVNVKTQIQRPRNKAPGATYHTYAQIIEPYNGIIGSVADLPVVAYDTAGDRH